MHERIPHTRSARAAGSPPPDSGQRRRRGRRARLARRGSRDAAGEAPRGRGGPHREGDRGRPGARSAGHAGGHRGGPPVSRGFGRGRRRDRGEVRVAVLLLLAEEPMHGYRIMREVAVRSGGSWRLSPGAVYPTLGALEAEGLVAATGETGRSVYALTDAGREASDQLAGTTPPWESADEDALDELHHALDAVISATRQVADVGDSRQHSDAVAALVQVRRRLYALLAEEPTAPDPTTQDPTATDRPAPDQP